jgi:hypothetical protein
VNSSRRTWIGLAMIALVALAIVALPSGGSFVSLVNNTINAIFLTLIGISLVALYRNQREWLSQLADRDRAIVYGAFAVATLTLVAWPRFRELWNGGVILVVLILAACGFAVYRVWRESRRWMI